MIVECLLDFFCKKLCIDCEYFIPRVDIESLRRFPFFDLSKCCNSLSLNNPEISSITNKLSFKSTIKNHLLLKSDNFICNKLFCWSCSS